MKRFSFGGMVSSALSSDTVDIADVDDMMKGLYCEFETLEQKCFESISGGGKIIDTSAPKAPATDANEKTKDTAVDEVIEKLPIEYFTPDFDPVEGHLMEINGWGGMGIDQIERFMEKIENTDTDKDVIIGHLTNMIDENYDDLMACMKNIQSVDVDLCRAGLQIDHCRRMIKSADGVVSSGAIKLKKLSEKKEKLALMSDTIRSLKALKDIHKAMSSALTTGEVGRAAEFAKRLLESIHSSTYDQFVSLQSIRGSMQKAVTTLRQKSDKALKRLCSRKFATNEYDSVVRAYLILDYLNDTMKVNIQDNSSNALDDDYFIDSSLGCVEGLAQRVNRYQLEDIDACLHSAVMEYIYASQHKKQKAAAELAIAGAYNTMAFGEMVDLAEVPLNILYRRLSPDVVAPCIIRACEMLSDIVHTNYLITQWHSLPFDERNLNWDFLHRCPINLKEFSKNKSNIVNAAASAGGGGDSDEDEVHSSSEDEERPSDVKARNSDSLSSKRNTTDGEEGDDHDDRASRTSEHSNTNTTTPMKGGGASKLQDKFRLMQQQRSDGVNGSGGVDAQLSDETTHSIMSAFEINFNAGSSLLHPSSSSTSLDSTTEASIASSERTMRLNGVKLAFAYQHLCQSRTMLWEELVSALVEMLNLMTITSAVKPDDFLSMAWALNAMIALGKEFCGSDSKALSACLQDKSKEYFQHFHLESFQMIRQMVESESWCSVPVNLGEVGGILGMIKTNLTRDAATSNVLYSKGRIVGRKNNKTGRVNKRPSLTGAALNNATAATTGGGSTGESGGVPVVAGATVDDQAPSMLMLFGSEGNPFHVMINNNEDDQEEGAGAAATAAATGGGAENGASTSATAATAANASHGGAAVDSFWDVLLRETEEELASPSRTMRRNQDQQSSMVVTQSALNGLVKYTAKYMHMMYLLPTTASEIFNCLCQLYDYYLCAVYNGFVPADEKNKFMARPTKMTACAPDQSRDFEGLQSYMEYALSQVVNAGAIVQNAPEKDASLDSLSEHLASGGVGGGGSSTHSASTPGGGGLMQQALQPQFEALKISTLLRLPTVITFAEASTCYALTERIVAGESCWFVAMILSEIKSKICKLLPDRSKSRCESYVATVQVVAGQLRSLVYRAVCPMLVKQNQMLPVIVDCGWDSRKLREENHDWVNTLVDNCSEVWRFMMLTDQFAECSSLVREQVWLEVCQCAFDLVLEGYGKVRKCSSEGRAAMTMDVFALHEGLNSVHLCRPPRGKHHIDAYLRMSYMPEEEMMEWIQENWQSFAYRHILGMLVQTLTSVLNSKKLKDATAVIDQLYDVENIGGGGGVSTPLKDLQQSSAVVGGGKLFNRLREGADSSMSAFAGKFRRQSTVGGGGGGTSGM